MHKVELSWKDYVWKNYGRAFLDCYKRAKAEASRQTECVVTVRAP